MQYACEGEGLPSSNEISAWAQAALQGQPRDGIVTVRLVALAEGARLNRKYRQRTGATNVLSFPFDSAVVIGYPVLGDVIVCAPVALREAAEQGKEMRAHMAHLVVHGILHLLGWDHQAPGDAQRMERCEVEVLADLGFPNPYEA